MKSWYEIYSERMNQKYFSHVKFKYSPFIDTIIAGGICDPLINTFVELGCGAGNITKALIECVPARFKFLMIDNCPQMLRLAMQNNPFAQAYSHNILNTSNFHYQSSGSALVHSHGVLEHFNDSDINMIISNNRNCDQIHYVPGTLYKVPSRGDERLMGIDEWNRILKTNNDVRFDLSSFNDGYDIIIKTWRKL